MSVRPDIMRWAQDAASHNVDEMLKAWDREIAKEFEQLREAAKRQDEIRAQEEQRQSEIAQREAADRALDQAVLGSIQNLITNAEGHEKGLAIPAAHVASTTVHGPGIDFAGLLSKLEDDEAATTIDSAKGRESRKWAGEALSNGFMPRPGDLHTLLSEAKVDATYADRFGALEHRLQQIERNDQHKHPQLKGLNALQRIGVLNEYVDVLAAFGAQRLVGLVVRPSWLTAAPKAGPLPTDSTLRSNLPPGLAAALAEFAPIRIDASSGAPSTANRTQSPAQRAARKN